MSPTKQARGDSGKERKLHQWQNGEKTLGESSEAQLETLDYQYVLKTRWNDLAAQIIFVFF